MAGSFQSASVSTSPPPLFLSFPPKRLIRTLVLGCRAHQIVQDNLLVKSLIIPAETFSPIRLCSQFLEVRVWTWLFYFYFYFGGGGVARFISQHITAGEGRDQPEVSICSPRGSQLRCLDFHQLFTLCSIYSRVQFKAFQLWCHTTGFPYWHCQFAPAPSSEGLFLRPLLTPPQTCPPKSVHPNLPTPEQKPQTLFPGWGLGGRVSSLGPGSCLPP